PHRRRRPRARRALGRVSSFAHRATGVGAHDALQAGCLHAGPSRRCILRPRAVVARDRAGVPGAQRREPEHRHGFARVPRAGMLQYRGQHDVAEGPPLTMPSDQDMLAELKNRLAEIADLSSAGSVLGWDQATYMPSGGAVARARQSATLSRLAHEKSVDP